MQSMHTIIAMVATNGDDWHQESGLTTFKNKITLTPGCPETVASQLKYLKTKKFAHPLGTQQ